MLHDRDFIFSYGKTALTVPRNSFFIPYATFFSGEYDFLHPGKNDIVIDAGANIGMFTLQAARIVGSSGLIVSVEPQPDNIEFLKENIRLNSLTNVRVITKALYFQDELAVPFMGNGVGGHLSKSGSIMVETVSLKTVVSMLHGKEFWIKMDIAGRRGGGENEIKSKTNGRNGMPFRL
jgi:FkbM family methyltransferase